MNGKAWATLHLFRSTVPGAGEELRRWLLALRLGTAWRRESLSLVPLVLADVSGPADLLLPEAIERGELDVVEQGNGAVQQVLARNQGAADVLILEGDTLVGCKQNRMVAWTVLVAAGATAAVSVGCMESGRWTMGGRRFSAGAMAVDPHIRRRTKRETNASASGPGGPCLDQRRAWGDIDGRLRTWSVVSETADYHSGLAGRTARARQRVRDVRPVNGQVGVIALHDDRLLGLEVVAHPETWRALADRILPSYALGGELARVDPDFRQGTALPHPEAWLDAVCRAPVQERRAGGKGVDLILRGEAVSGTCLWDGQTVRHMAVFSR